MNFHAAPHPHYLLQSIDNRYRALIDEMEQTHARAIAELKEGYNSILRLQETLIFEQAKHIARLENQLRPTAPPPPPSESAGGPSSLLSPPSIPPRSERRLSATSVSISSGLLAPPEEGERPRSYRLDSFSTVLSGDTGFYSDIPEPTPAELELQRKAREQIAAWKRQVGAAAAGTESSVEASSVGETEQRTEPEEDERTIRAGSRGMAAERDGERERSAEVNCASPVSVQSSRWESKEGRSRRSKGGLGMFKRFWERRLGRVRTS